MQSGRVGGLNDLTFVFERSFAGRMAFPAYSVFALLGR
jgi:hypothetical protein